MKPLIKLLALCAATSLLAIAPAYGQTNGWHIVVDEWGNSSYTPGQLMPDPTGGVLNWNVLVYNLPFPGILGDVRMFDQASGGTNLVMLDVLRFDGNFHLIFYSDNTDGYDSPADTPHAPSPLFPNQASIFELGPEGGFQYGDYAPTPNQPGWDPSNPTYRFISDVPEPGSVVFLFGGLALLSGASIRRKR